MALRVVLADDNYLVREGITALLAEVEEIELVDSVGDPQSLLKSGYGDYLLELLDEK